MDPRKLEHFLSVIEHGQFNLAAQANGVTQQAVSKAIAKLEEDLGVKLFERSAFGATPTVYARALEKRAQTVLAETRLATAELNALSGAKLGTLNIGVGLTMARRIVPAAIHRFRTQRPGIGISASVDISQVLYQRLLRGEHDLVVSAPPEAMAIPPGVTTIPIFTEIDKIVVRPTHPLTALKRVTIADLLPYPWLAPRENYAIWHRVCQTYAAAGMEPPRDVIRTDSAPLVFGLLANEDCVSLLGVEMIAYELASGSLVTLDIPELVFARPATIAFRAQGTLSPAAKAFIPLVREVTETYYASAP